jgi:hypothetical protein
MYDICFFFLQLIDLAESYCCLSDTIQRKLYDDFGLEKVQPVASQKAAEEVERLKLLLYMELYNSIAQAFSGIFK